MYMYCFVRHKADEIAHAVPLRAFEESGHDRLVVDVGLQDLHMGWHPGAPVPPVQERELPLFLRGQFRGDGGADRSRPTDE